LYVGHVERKVNGVWVKQCMSMEIEEIRHMECLKKAYTS